MSYIYCMESACVEIQSEDADSSDARANSPSKRTPTKRKQLLSSGKDTAGSMDTTPKQASAESGGLVSFKNGKIVFSEKKLGLERHPSVVAAVFKFHQLISKLKEDGNGGALPLTSIPSDHWPLLAMMVQERDAAIGTLVKSIEMQLCPVVFGEEATRNSDILAHGAVEGAILQIAEQQNYGPSLRDLQECCGPELEDIPSVTDVRDVVKRRRELRHSAHDECTQWFQTLDSDTQVQILAGTLKKLKVKAQNQQHREAACQGDSAPPAPKAMPMLRGQQSLQTFFGSEKTSDREKTTSMEPLVPRSYYESTFLPFNLRANAEMYRHQSSASFDVATLDAVIYHENPAETHARNKDSLLQKLQNTPRTPPQKQIHIYPVCEGIEIDEAEVQLLRLRQMPMKLLHFHGSRRPDYWGTWSRSLRRVNGRQPFAKDTDQLDYEVDSDAEWEIEEEGEELRSDDDDDEDDEDDDDEDDEDFDEVNGFVVGDRIPKPCSSSLVEDGSDGESNDSSSESDFNSEDEEIEEINPEEEVSMDQMDVDEETNDHGDSENPSKRRSSRRAAKPSTELHVSEEYFKRENHQPKQRHKVVPITPVVVGLLWDGLTFNGAHHANVDTIASTPADSTLAMLSRLAVVETCINMPLHVSMDPQEVLCSKSDGSAGVPARKSKALNDEDLFVLANVVHGSSLGISKLVDEVKTHIPEAKKAQIERLIHEHAVKEKRPPATRQIWYVNSGLVDRAREARKNDPPLPHLGRPRLSKNPLLPSKDQERSTTELGFVGPFSSLYSTVGTITLDQAEEDYRQVLCKISESKKDTVVVGKKATDISHGSNGSDDVEIVTGTPGSSSYYSDED
ncbi:hypothetical protein IW138_002694 [Coemansia sp. RSA 986]|nr:hypothetical protein IW138_002694 [Coemansia sp. RSA 986]